jgi:hypothetical protein
MKQTTSRRSFLHAAAGVGLWAQVFDPSQPLPASLPVPVDDGACKHLWLSRQHVEKVIYPVFPPDTHAAEVIDWLRHHPTRGS